MSRPLEFAARLLSRRGALVDASGEALEAVLPRELASQLDLAEHVLLSDSPSPQGHAVGFGSSLLERLLALAAGGVPFVTARAALAPARSSLARAAAQALVFRNGVFEVGEPTAMPALRAVAHAAFILHGDERREGLCSGAISLRSGGALEGFEDAVAGTLEQAKLELPAPEQVLSGARACLGVCANRAVQVSAGFRESMQRRFERDRERLEGYFADLLAELENRVARGRTGGADIGEKRQVIERERAAKLEALSARYVMKLEVRPVALLVVEAPVHRMALRLRRRKAAREVEVEYDGATRRLVPPACDGCGSPAERPAACDDALHLLCESCAPRSEGRLACPACRARRRA